MADLAVWQRTIVDEEGNVIPGAEIEVRREEDDSLATLYADRAGETPLANPMAADMSGFVRFFAQGDAYTITAVGAGSTRTWRFDPTGRLQEFDRISEALVADDAADLLSARSNLGTFSSVAEVQSRHIPAVLESIRTDGYYSPGDGGGALYKRVPSEPSHEGKIQSADGAWWELSTAGWLDVRQFGAVADFDLATETGTDNTAQFNAVTSYLRASQVREGGPTGRMREAYSTVAVRVPPGAYLLDEGWDLTDFREGRNITIIADGAVLVGGAGTNGYPIVDALDSRWLHFVGLTTIGFPGVGTRAGVQIGKTGQIVALGNNFLERVVCTGDYSLAAFANFGSETTIKIRCRFGNENTGAEAYAEVSVGDFHYLPTSRYKTVTAVVGTEVSFTQNASYGCDFRNHAGGNTIFHSASMDHYYDPGCYYVAFNNANFVLSLQQGARLKSLTIMGHWENSGSGVIDQNNPGVQTSIHIIGDGNNIGIQGLHLHMATPHADSELIRVSNGGTNNRISQFTLKVVGVRAIANPVFFAGESFAFDGEIVTADADLLNLGHLDSFNGSISCNDIEDIPSFCGGGYTIHERGMGKTTFIGDIEQRYPSATGNSLVIPSNDFTPSVTFENSGDLSVSYSVQTGRYVEMSGGLVFVRVALRFTPTFSTASGNLHITGLPFESATGALEFQGLSVSDIYPISLGGGNSVFARIPPNQSVIEFSRMRDGNSSIRVNADAFTSGVEATIIVSGIYQRRL